jgi:hypothetical protein
MSLKDLNDPTPPDDRGWPLEATTSSSSAKTQPRPNTDQQTSISATKGSMTAVAPVANPAPPQVLLVRY